MAGLQKKLDDFRDDDITVVAVSSDGETNARKMKEDEELEFAVLYDADIDEMKARLGLYTNEGERTHLQPAQFVLDGDGRVTLACYSSGPVGRLDAEEALVVARRAAGG